jgi:CheY-like chemotaxis protein
MSDHQPVLIIDDDTNSNQVIADNLRFRGFEPTSMYSGQTALDYLKDLPEDQLPRAILLDVLMPGMNGCQVLQEIRSGEHTRKIPVILLSVLSQDEIREQLSCPCGGFNGYINKPYDMRDVIKKLEGCVHE